MSDQSCPVCGSVESEMRTVYRGNHYVFKNLNRNHCSSCGMVFAAPMPQEALLEEFNANYFASAHGGPPRNIQESAFFSGIAQLRIMHLVRYLNSRNISVSSLLEFGPGTGYFARNWLAQYPNTIYQACETDGSCHASLKGIGVHVVAEQALAEEKSPIDIVVMSHVLEHVARPIEFLKYATQNLRNKGVLFIEVPCRDWEHKSVDEPHLLFFDKGPMELLLSKLGFDDIQVSYHGQEIHRLRSASSLRDGLIALRSRLIALGFVTPFASHKKGMEGLTDPLERAVVAPFKAHRETQKPAWWLRAIARKNY